MKDWERHFNEKYPPTTEKIAPARMWRAAYLKMWEERNELTAERDWGRGLPQVTRMRYERLCDQVEALLAERDALWETLEAIANGDYEGRKLWEHNLAAATLQHDERSGGYIAWTDPETGEAHRGDDERGGGVSIYHRMAEQADELAKQRVELNARIQKLEAERKEAIETASRAMENSHNLREERDALRKAASDVISWLENWQMLKLDEDLEWWAAVRKLEAALQRDERSGAA